MDEKTYVLFTLSGAEHEVIDALERYILRPDEDSFCPTLEMKKRIHGKDQIVVRNMYPGYVFLTTPDPYDLLVRVKRGINVVLFKHVRILRNRDGGFIYPLETEEAQMLYELTGEEHNCGVSTGIAYGDRIEVISGPLANFSGRIRSINRHKKNAVITTRLLGRDVNVTVGLEIIKKVKK